MKFHPKLPPTLANLGVEKHRRDRQLRAVEQTHDLSHVFAAPLVAFRALMTNPPVDMFSFQYLRILEAQPIHCVRASMVEKPVQMVGQCDS